MKKALLFSIFMGFIPVSHAVVVHTPPPDSPPQQIREVAPAPQPAQAKQNPKTVQKVAPAQNQKQAVVRKNAPQVVRQEVIRKPVVVQERVATSPRVMVKKKRYVKRYMNPPRKVVRERVIVRRPPPRVVEERVIERRPPVVREYRYYEPRRVVERRYYEPVYYAPAPVSFSIGVMF